MLNSADCQRRGRQTARTAKRRVPFFGSCAAWVLRPLAPAPFVPCAVQPSSSDVPSISPRHHLRLLAAVALGLYGWARLRNAEHWDLLDDVNLAVHEAGHVFFGPLGDHMAVLGGSLFQVLVPLAFVIYFLVRRDMFAGSVVMAWLGASLGNVALYISDARAQELPLLGGENVIHDWWYLLIEWDLLPHDLVIARWVRMAGALAVVTAVTGGILFAKPGIESRTAQPASQ